MKKIICISGKAQHVKGTTATILSPELENRGNRWANIIDLAKRIDNAT